MKFLISGLMLLSLAFSTQATTIDLTPSTSTLTLGEQFNLQTQIHGLNDFSAPALGAYDLNLSYDASKLQLDAILWGDASLGNQLDLMGFGSLQDMTESSSGNLNIFELSFDDADYLDAFQAGSFTLFELVFTSIAAGEAHFSLSLNALSDAWGNELSVDTLGSSRIVIQSAQVPEASSYVLIIIGLLAIAFIRQNRRI